MATDPNPKPILGFSGLLTTDVLIIEQKRQVAPITASAEDSDELMGSLQVAVLDTLLNCVNYINFALN